MGTTIDIILKGMRKLYASSKMAKGNITLGFSKYLILTMTAMHLTLGTLLTTDQFVGAPMNCFKETGLKEGEECALEYHFLPVGPERKEGEMTYAFFKITHWILYFIGKI